MCTYENLAHGVATVCSTERPECHAPSGYRVNDYSGSNGSRDRMRDMVLLFWESQGIARWQSGGAGGGGRWLVRDMAQGGAEWLPLATQGEEDRADRAVFSHIVAASKGGAWCACNLMPESGAVNEARSDLRADVPPAMVAVFAAWRGYWTANHARKASLARL